MEVDEGRTSALLRPSPGKGKKGVQDSMVTMQRKGEAVVGVYVLRDAGYAGEEARIIVGKDMGLAGHSSRKRREVQAISADTIKKWIADYQSKDPALRKFAKYVDRRLGECRAEPGYPPSKEAALEYIKRVMRDPLIKEPANYD
jgi:hypothetical protein